VKTEEQRKKEKKKREGKIATNILKRGKKKLPNLRQLLISSISKHEEKNESI
jgi:hypothetical protein